MVIYQPEGPFKRLPFPHIGACAVGVTAFTARPVKQAAGGETNPVFPPGKKWMLTTIIGV